MGIHIYSTCDFFLYIIVGVFNAFKVHFEKLKAKAEKELNAMSKATITPFYKLLPSRDEENLHLCCGYCWPPTKFEELFKDVNNFCQIFFDYKLLEFVILNTSCTRDLKNDIEQYSNNVVDFRKHTSISTFLKYRCMLLNAMSLPDGYEIIVTKCEHGYETIVTKYEDDPTERTLETLDCFRRDFWRNPEFSECTLHICKITTNSVEWAIPDAFRYTLMEFICSDDGQDLLQQYHIEAISTGDVTINHSV